MNYYKHILSLLVIAVFLFIALASASVNAVYTPPEPENSSEQYSKVIDKPFNEVWDALINYSASTFFGIDNFEKESGLLTLSFGASNPQEYITGGYWKTDVTYGVNEFHFEGDYVEYLSLYQNGELNGKMNIVVKKIDDEKTKVTINARYVFAASIANANGQTFSNSWVFNTGHCQEVLVSNPTKGTQPSRTICPTYKAENAILDALE